MKYSESKDQIVYSIDDSIDLFLEKEENKKYINKKGEEVEITPRLYRKIIAKFLQIWLYDFLWNKGSYYFFLSGEAFKFKIPGKVDIDRKTGKVKEFETSIGVDWRRRAFGRLYTFDLKKTNGSTNKFTHAQKEWKKYNSVESLLTLREHITIQRKNES